jgi:hypothetical protein
MSPAPPRWMISDQSLASIFRATTITGADVRPFAPTKSCQVPSESFMSVKITCTGVNLSRNDSACRQDRARQVSIPWLARATRNVCNGSNSA